MSQNHTSGQRRQQKVSCFLKVSGGSRFAQQVSFPWTPVAVFMELSVRLNHVFLAAWTSFRARPKWCSRSCKGNNVHERAGLQRQCRCLPRAVPRQDFSPFTLERPLEIPPVSTRQKRIRNPLSSGIFASEDLFISCLVYLLKPPPN